MGKPVFAKSIFVSIPLLAASHVSAAGQSCYSRALGNIISGDWVQCENTALSVGGAQSCCMAGSLCGEDSLCHVPDFLNTANATNTWYPSGCTDPTYQDPVCRLSCTTNLWTWTIYNSSTHLWNCCGEGNCNGTVTGETFSAIAPSRWSAVPTTATNFANVAATVSLPSTSSTSSISTTSTTSTSQMTTAAPSTTPASIPTVAPASATPAPSKNTSLSTGAQAGIGIGIAVVAIAILAGAAFLLMRRRRRAAAAHDRSGPPGYDDAVGAHHNVTAKHYTQMETAELDSTVFRNELEARNPAQELPAEALRHKE